MYIVSDNTCYRLKYSSFFYTRARGRFLFNEIFEDAGISAIGGTCFLDSCKNVRELFKANRVSKVDLTKPIYVDSYLKDWYSTLLDKAQKEKNINFVERPENAEYIITCKDVDEYLSCGSETLKLVFDQNCYFDLGASRYYSSEINKTFECLKENEIFSNDAKFVTFNREQWTYLDPYHAHCLMPVLAGTPYCVLEDFFKLIIDEFIPLEAENIKMLMELLNSDDKETQLLGGKLFITSNYTNRPMVTRYLVHKYGDMLSHLDLDTDEKELLTHLLNKVGYPRREMSLNIGCLNYLTSNEENPNQEDINCLKEIFDETDLVRKVSNSISNKTIKSLDLLGYKVEVNITKK